jgi:31-O-methyltransferase
MKSCLLPTGERIHYRSRADVDLLLEEMDADDNIYTRHGIHLGPGSVVVDVGANLGFFTLHLARTLPDATVVAIEPVPEVFAMLDRTVKANCPGDVRLLNCAVGTPAGQVEMTYFPRMSLASSLFPQDTAAFRANSRRFVLGEMARRSPLFSRLLAVTPGWMWFPLAESVRRYYHTTQRVSCEVRPLGDILRDERLTRVDLLKIDTEGAEEQVVASVAAEQWPMIRQVVVEVHGGPPSAERMQAMLGGVGFKTSTEPLRDDADHLHVVYAVR